MNKYLEAIKEKRLYLDFISMLLGIATIVFFVLVCIHPKQPNYQAMVLITVGLSNLISAYQRITYHKKIVMGVVFALLGVILTGLGAFYLYILNA
ncbi:MAG: hypothetical protein K6G65_05315 [Lachnospiraceae bacterium]|nr:hypothetical protein [Lachnospiraceae bacterium]